MELGGGVFFSHERPSGRNCINFRWIVLNLHLLAISGQEEKSSMPRGHRFLRDGR